jgi:hypothetical protein
LSLDFNIKRMLNELVSKVVEIEKNKK